jgi:phosphatidylglycerophosphate synthase
MLSLTTLRKPIGFHLESYSRSFVARIPRFISPNLLTWGNLVFSILTGIAFAIRDFNLVFIALSFAFVCDTFDGIIARTRNELSTTGYFLDSGVDRLGEAAFFYGMFLSGLFPDEAILLTAISAFLINYFRVQIFLTSEDNTPGFMEKGDRNFYFFFLVIALVLVVDVNFLILSLWVVCFLSIGTVIQLFVRGIKQSSNNEPKLNRDIYKMTGT